MDALQVLTGQHEEVEALCRAYEATGSDDEQGRTDIAKSLIDKLSRHSGIEELAFYPTVRDALPDAADEIDHDLQEHVEIKRIVQHLGDCEPLSTDYDDTMRELILATRLHVEDEEAGLFPRVQSTLTAQELNDLGAALEGLIKVEPTRPEPGQPSALQESEEVGPIMTAIDRMRDQIRDRTSDTSV